MAQLYRRSARAVDRDRDHIDSRCASKRLSVRLYGRAGTSLEGLDLRAVERCGAAGAHSIRSVDKPSVSGVRVASARRHGAGAGVAGLQSYSCRNNGGDP